jgi:hypothetical protein
MSSNIFDLINFLFKRKYGHISLAPYPITPLGSPMSPNDDLNEKSHNKLLGKVKAYKSELAALPREELEALVKIELQKQEALDKIESQKRKQEDARLFFNEPKSQAVFMDWGIQAYWTHEEAAALFIGKNPKVVTRKKMQPFSSEELLEHHSVSREYHKRLELFGRAIELNLLSIKSSPLDYAIYARSNNLEIPASLIESFSDQNKVAFEKLTSSKESTTSNSETPSPISIPTAEINHPLAVFQIMNDLRFDEITLKFDPGNIMVRVAGRNKKVTIPFIALGIMKKNQLSLNRPGEILVEMAKDLYYPDKSDSTALSRLIRSLRTAFKTSSQPFFEGKPNFKYYIPKDREAKFYAQRNSKEYEDSSGFDYLKDNDPDYDPDNGKYFDDHD